ncbi:MAG: 50S ribosomal protein L28 [Candidatus Schekmanbacteria bacterium]|nr:50S ribosomal protein L28 [Candidatus Schekmanbacteria bacterium]
MAGTCDICGKGIQFGNKVSHANNKAKKIWHPNIQKAHVIVNGTTKHVDICTKCLSAGKVQKIA